MKDTNILNKVGLPLILQLDEMEKDDFISYYIKNKNEIEKKLLQRGAIKFTGVRIDSLETFKDIVDSVSSKFLNYIDGNSPRTKLTGNVYTSTEYDKTQRITMHNELSYSAKWPNKLFFSCLKPAETGGQTLVADSREILEKMNKDIVEEIEKRGIIYVRNLHDGTGIGPSWQSTFETDDKSLVEEYCKAYSIKFSWKNDGSVRLIQPGRGIIEHRITKERVWFNQIDQFHPYQLGEELYNAMHAIYNSPDDFPSYVKFADGKEISEGLVSEILKTIEETTVAPTWEMNELLIIDNELASHGRNPFTGDRTVVVAMSE